VVAVADAFEHRVNVDLDGQGQAKLPEVPAAWAVYLMSDERDRPVQLLCVKNLRASVRRRLDPELTSQRTADLSMVVRTIYYTRVDSAFEQDLRYLEAARVAFPESYGGVLGFLPTWFVHFNPATKYPRLTRQNRIDKRTGLYLGPFADKNHADRHIRSFEELFDLCRDRDRLLSDKSDPCQWREMGKCVGPCEGPPGGVSLDAYRALCAEAADVAANPVAAARAAEARMSQAAVEMRYEAAAALKQRAASLAALREKNSRFCRPIESFRYLAIQPGGDGAVKLFAIRPNDVRFVAAVFDDQPGGVLDAARALLAEPQDRPLEKVAYETLSLVASHLFAPKKLPGLFIHADDVDGGHYRQAVAAVLREQSRAGDTPSPNDASEGEVRGLRSLEAAPEPAAAAKAAQTDGESPKD
jgi:excinuclease UvrABC nuclease subunit